MQSRVGQFSQGEQLDFLSTKLLNANIHLLSPKGEWDGKLQCMKKFANLFGITFINHFTGYIFEDT